ncbi:ABC transporter permease subunit [Agrobacterium tumefaciens]|uniref:amino acid ABC transporter permease n=1 Tax=Agrobacterium fabrum TaxID=1176649 RepID=UPI001573A592|nr:ABC transporter permease subunit [Agrobacterium fabrum]NTE84777.1 ABC transporter permease subunit [Agrobacterium tumefaciens]
MLYDLDFSIIPESIPYLFGQGMALSITLTLLAGAMALALGAVLAVCRLSPSKVLSVPAGLYVNLFRSVPLLLVIFWFYFLVPYLTAWVIGSPRPVQVGAYRSALVSFTLFEAAYFCEIIRAGIQAIPRGQISASLALGLTYRHALLSVIIPQALQKMTPSLLTRMIVLFQDTSLVYVISLTDFLGAASKIGQRDGRLTEMFIFAAFVYLVICFTASQMVKLVDKKGYLRR